MEKEKTFEEPASNAGHLDNSKTNVESIEGPTTKMGHMVIEEDNVENVIFMRSDFDD